MIVSHRHRFIFIKTRKTAGTSVEIALSKFCGAEDIISPLSKSDERIRQELGYPGPQNVPVPFSRHTIRTWLKLSLHPRGRNFYNHMRASVARHGLPRNVWDNYFKFTVERNPWDKAISLYHWRMRGEASPPTLSQFLQSGHKHLSNFDLYAIDGQIAMDHVCQYENLAEEMEMLAERLGLDDVPALPNAKGNIRTDRRKYHDVMGPSERDMVAKVCHREIDAFEYRFAA